MLDPEFAQRYGPEALADVEALEQWLGCSLPAEYRARLLTTGLGHDPRRNFFRVAWRSDYDGDSGANRASHAWVTTFLRPSELDPSFSIRTMAEASWQDILGWPRELLPIATSFGAGTIFVGLRGEVRGQVHFGYADDLRDGPPSFRIVAFCSPDFGTWMNSLVAAEELPHDHTV